MVAADCFFQVYYDVRLQSKSDQNLEVKPQGRRDALSFTDLG